MRSDETVNGGKSGKRYTNAHNTHNTPIQTYKPYTFCKFAQFAQLLASFTKWGEKTDDSIFAALISCSFVCCCCCLFVVVNVYIFFAKLAGWTTSDSVVYTTVGVLCLSVSTGVITFELFGTAQMKRQFIICLK